MTKRKRVYLPKWQRWYFTPMFVGIWGFITYMEFWNPSNSEKLGLIGYGFFTLLFLGIGSMLWAMTSGKLAAYEIDDSE